jgi:hypothetical protein
MKPQNFLLVIFICLLACNPNSQKDPVAAPRIVELRSLGKEPQPVDFISISGGDYKKLVADIKSTARLDTTSSFDYNQGLLISESPFADNSFIIHPPSTPFDKGGRVAAAIINEHLTFFGICPDDNPDCPSFPPKGPDLPDLCDPPPCMPDFDFGDFKPLPRPACNAIVLPNTLNSACSLRKPCEQSNHTCQPLYRIFKNSFISRSGTVTRPLVYIYFTCKCDCA